MPAAGAWVLTGGAWKRKGRADRTPVASGPTGRPTGPGYVRYEDLYVSGNTLRQVFAKVTNLDVLTFPEGEFTFSNFNDPVGNFDGIRVPVNCRGIAGSGPNTIFKMVAGSSTVGGNTTAVPPASGTNACDLIAIDNVTAPVFRNFSLIGTDQGHPYNGLKVSDGPGAIVEGLYLRGAAPGYANFPPGETFGINMNRSSSATLRNCEIDGRNESGTVVGASPFGWNNTSDAYVQDVYAHHSVAGMPTFYNTVNVHTVRLRSEFHGSGSGSLNGAGINHENCSGTILHESPTLIINRAGGNTGLHITLQNGVQNVTGITLTGVTHDVGPGSHGCFSVMIGDGYHDPNGNTQKQTSLPTVTKGGITLTPLDANVSTAGANAATHFVRYH